MDLIAIITSLLTLLAGIGVFLIACQMMSSNLEAASSEKLKNLFSKASDKGALKPYKLMILITFFHLFARYGWLLYPAFVRAL